MRCMTRTGQGGLIILRFRWQTLAWKRLFRVQCVGLFFGIILLTFLSWIGLRLSFRLLRCHFWCCLFFLFRFPLCLLPCFYIFDCLREFFHFLLWHWRVSAASARADCHGHSRFLCLWFSWYFGRHIFVVFSGSYLNCFFWPPNCWPKLQFDPQGIFGSGTGPSILSWNTWLSWFFLTWKLFCLSNQQKCQ